MKLPRIAERTSLIYIGAGLLWIQCSDWLLGKLVRDPAWVTRISIAKGFAFVVFTGGLLYLVLRREVSRWERETAEKEAARAELEQFQAKLSELALSVPGVVYAFRLRADGAMEVPYASPRLNEMFGVDPATVVADARPLIHMVHAEDRGKLLGSIEGSARTLTPWHCVFRVRSARGPEVWVEGRSVPRREADGSVLWHGLLLDATDRHRAEVQLLRQQAELQMILDSVPAFVFYKDREHRMLRVNAEMLRVTGRSREEVEGRTETENGSPYAESYYRDENEVIATGQPKLGIVERLVTTQGDRWMRTDKFPNRDESGRIIGVVGFALDITEQVRAREIEERQLRVIEAVRRAQEEYIATRSLRAALGTLLDPLLNFTAGEFGFLGEVVADLEGRRCLQVLALTNIAWDAVTRGLYARHESQGLVFSNLNSLFGAVITGAELVISNDPARDPRRGGLPPGHPPLRSFLGIPLKHGNEVVGVIGVANRPGGFEPATVVGIEPLLTTCVSLIQADREARRHREAEAARLQGELRFRSLVETIDQIFWTSPPGATSPSYVSPAVEAITGWPADHFVSQPGAWMELVVPEDRARLAAAIASEPEGRRAPIEYRIINRAGQRRWIWSRAFPVRDESGAVVAFNGIASDITERREAEQALLESEQRFQRIFESSPVLHSMSSYPEGRCLMVNRHFTDRLGYSLEDLQGVSALDSGMWVKPEQRQQLLRDLEAGGPVLARECLNRAKDGSLRHLLTSVNRVVVNGQASLIFAAADITDRKRAEEEVARRDAILASAEFAGEQFLREQDWETAAHQVLARVGEAAAASRAYLFENFVGPAGDLRGSQRCEWCAPGIEPQLENPLLQDLPYEEAGIWAWCEQLSAGRSVVLALSQAGEAERRLLEGQQIQSLAIVPLMVSGQWWGVIGLDECTCEREWLPSELEALRVVADMLGAAIARKQVESLQRGLAAVVEMIARGAGLAETLARLCRIMEGQSPDLLCSVLLLDGEGRLRLGAAPSLPADYNAAIDGLAIGPNVGSRGTAAFRRESVVVADIATDPLWQDFRELALRHGLKACWSTPIIDASDRVLGTVAFYYRHSGSPGPGHLRLVGPATHTAAVCIANARSAESLRLSEERFRLAMTGANDGLWDWDLVSEAVFYSPRWKAMLGYGDAELGNRLETWRDLLHPEDLEAALAMVAQLRRGEIDSFEAEHRLRHRQGHWVHVLSRGTVSRDAHGTPIRVSGTHVDITERKAAEAALEQSLSLARAALESTADGILVVDLAGRIVDFNSQFLEVWRFPDDLVPAGRRRDLFSAGGDEPAMQHVLGQLSDPPAFIAKVAELYSRPEAVSFDELRFKDGRIVERYSIPQRINGKPVGRVWSFRDVTSRRAAEQSLRSVKENLEVLVEAMPDLIVFEDAAGHWQIANQAARRLFRVEDQDWRGRTHRELLNMVPELRSVHEVCLQREGETWAARQVLHSEKQIPRPDGTLVQLEMSRVPMFDADGAPKGLLVVGRDVTARHHLELQLRHSQKMEAIGQLAGGVAHDFNNLLTIIQGNVSLLLDSPELGESNGVLAGEILTASQRAAGLTRQLLLFGRKSAMQAQELDLNEVVSNLSKMLRRTLGEDVTFSVQLASGLSAVRADAGMIEQVLLNLAVNSRDAMPQGGTLTIATGEVELTVESLPANPQATVGRYVTLAVSDTGQGIPADVLPRIFDPFFTTKSVGKGTGLGLATVYGIVQQHRGWIEVTSDSGEGATFRIFLPALARPVTTAPRVQGNRAPAFPAGDDGGVLLVEDEPAVRQLVCGLFQRHGFRVFTAVTGTEAVGIWAEHAAEIGLLFTDITMPGGLTGVELAKRLKEQSPNLGVIVTSGFAADLGSYGLSEIPGCLFLQKPFSPAELAEVVGACLKLRP